MTLPITGAQWTALAMLAGLIALDTLLAWLKHGIHGTFDWRKFALFIRKQLYVVGSGIVLAVLHHDAPTGTQVFTSSIWWGSAIAVGMQYVFGDILGDKLGIIPSLQHVHQAQGGAGAAGKDA